MRKIIWFSIFAIAINISNAKNVEITESLIVGANETINIARDTLFNKIKLSALESSGTFATSEKTYDSINDKISEKVSMRKLARVFIRKHQEEISINDGKVILTIHAVVEIKERNDFVEIEKNVLLEKDATIAGLEFQNKILEKRLGTSLSDVSEKFINAENDGETHHLNDEYSVAILSAGQLVDMNSKRVNLQKISLENIRKNYSDMWSEYSTELRPVVKSVYRDIGAIFLSIDVLLPKNIFDETMERLSISLPSKKNWSRISDLRNRSSDDDSHVIESAEVITSQPVFLVVQVGASIRKIPFFGLGQETFIGDSFEPFAFDRNNITIKDVLRKYKRASLGFYKTVKTVENYRVEDGHAVIDLRITESDMLSASNIKTRFVASDEATK